MDFPCKRCISFAICNGVTTYLECELLLQWYESGHFRPKKIEKLYNRKVRGWCADHIFERLEVTFRKEDLINGRRTKKSNRRKK